MRQLLATNRFGLLLAGNYVSAVGNYVHVAVTSWLLFELTRSSAMVGMLTIAAQAPIVALTLPAGMVADTRDRRRWMILVQAWMMTLAAVLAVLVWTGRTSSALLIGVTAGIGIGHAFGGPTWMALVTDVVPRDRALTAFSLNSVSFHLAAATGPVLGTALLVSIGASGAFAFNAVSFLFVMAGLRALRTRPQTRRAAEGLRRSVHEMYLFARYSHRARRLLPVSGAIALAALGLPAVLPAFASEVLGGTSGTYGWLSGAYGVGSLSGAVFLGLLSTRVARRTIIVAGAWLVAGGAVFLAVGAHPVPAALGVWGVGAGQLMFLVTSRTVIQLDAPEHLRARAVSLWFIVAVGFAPLGGLGLGWITDAVGITTALTATAIYSVTLAVVLTAGMRTRARYVTPYEELMASP